MNIDSSIQIGTGHLMRCLTLADALRGKGAVVSFICRELPGNLCDSVEKKGTYGENQKATEGRVISGKRWRHLKTKEIYPVRCKAIYRDQTT